MINSIPVIPTPTPIVMDPGQVIRPMTTPMVIPGGGTGARIRSTTGGVAPVRGPSNNFINRRARRETLADNELARRQLLEDEARIRKQKIEDAEWEREAKIMDYETDREWDLAKEDRDLNRELDKEKARIESEIAKEKREEKYKIAAEERAAEQAQIKSDQEWERGKPERELREKQINAQIELSQQQLEEVKQRMEDNKKKYDLEVEKAYFQFRSNAKSVRSGAKLKKRITSFIDDLPNKKQAILDKARANAMVHVLALVKMGDNIDPVSEEFLDPLYEEFDINDFSELTDETQRQKFLDKVLIKAQNDELALGGYVKSIKDTLERSVLEHNNLVRQHEIYLNMLTRVSDKEIDEESYAVLDKEFKKILGLNNKSISSVNAKGGLDSEGNPTTPPADANLIAPDLKTPASAAEPTEEETKDFIDDLTNKDPGKEVIADPEGESVNPTGDEVEQADSFLDPKTGDDDLEEEEEDSRYNSMLINAGSAIGDGVDKIGEAISDSGIVDAASNAVSSAADMAISPEGAAITGSLLATDKGREIIGQAGQTLKDTGRGIANATITPTGSQYATDELKNLQGVLNEAPDDLVEKPVKQVWTDPETGLPAEKGTKGAVPSKVNRLQPEGIANKVNQALGANGSKTFTEPPPAPEGNAKKDLRARAEWQLRLRDHVNTQVQESRKALGVRLNQSVQSMKAKGSRVKGKVPSGVLDFIGNVMKGLVIVEVAYLGKDLVDYLSMEDPKLLEDIKAHEPLEAAREQVQADLNATAAEAQELVQ